MAEMKTVVVGDILIQDNQERTFASDPQYAVVWVHHVIKREYIPLMLTREELNAAFERAQKNDEDIPELDSETAINEWDEE